MESVDKDTVALESVVKDTVAIEPVGDAIKQQDKSVEKRSGGEVGICKKQEAGTAMIKSEYIDVHYKPRLVSTYLPDAARDEIQQVVAKRQLELCAKKDCETVEPEAQDRANSIAVDNSTENAEEEEKDQSQPPPAKKAKLKGRNKKRPIEKRPQTADKLCASIVALRPCSYGERCKFSHDVEKFLSEKPRIDSTLKCPVFETYGVCPFGIRCLYSDQHKISADAKDSVTGTEDGITSIPPPRVEGDGVPSGPPPVINVISKDLQIKLRKREFNFSCANKVLRQVDEQVRKQRKQLMCENDVKLLGNDAKLTVDSSLATPELGDVMLSTAIPEKSLVVESKICSSSAVGSVTDEDIVKLRACEKPTIDFRNKLYLAPLTTVGNLPFRRVCKRLGADITCGEMAMPLNLLQGQASEWALLKRHESENLFGIQLCGSYADTMTRTAQVICENMTVDFIDINIGCPIDLVVQRGEGCALMNRVSRFEQIIQSMRPVMNVPLTVKMRTGMYEDRHTAHTLLPKLFNLGVAMTTIHGRSREQRYTKMADWQYIKKCVDIVAPHPVFGNGDILSYEDYNNSIQMSGVAGCMLARGALVKPWLFTEIKEQRHWDISSTERLDIVKEYVNYGLEHWGSDQQGVSNTRRFLLEWLSFLHRYVPVGILERVPQRINEKPPHYFGRNDLETLMASSNCADWIKISEMLLGPVPDGFTFLPKHRANSFA